MRIWNYRKKILAENISFDIKDIVRSLVQSFHSRKNIEPRLKSCSKIPNIAVLCAAANQAKNNISLLLSTAITGLPGVLKIIKVIK